MRLLSLCGMLAAGEYLASFVPGLTAAWPFVLVCAALVALFGYGLDVKGWRHTLILLFGVALYLAASGKDEARYRESPWMRGRDWRYRQQRTEPDGWAKDLKDDFSRRIGIGVENDRESASLMRAILLGERGRMSFRTKRLFVESGTMHVFAISGLHVMAIADVLTFALMCLMVPRRFAGLLSAPLLWGYVHLIGFSPSAVRAALMATFSLTAPLAWRRSDGLRSWSLTFLIVHLSNPLMITNVGNVLSFAVMLAIVIVGEAVRNLPKWQRTLLVTMAAWAVGVPIAARVFGHVTPGGMLANLILIGTVKLTVLAGAIGVASSFVSNELAAHVNNLCALGIRAMVLVAEGVSRVPGGDIAVEKWSIFRCCAWCFSVIALVFVFSRIFRKHLL